MPGSIFDRLSDSDAAAIKKAGSEVTLPAGWSPIWERTPSDQAYIVLDGEFSVRRGGEEIAILGPGDVVGESAIVNHSLRTATVVAVTPLTLLRYSKETFLELCQKYPALDQALRELAHERSVLSPENPGKTSAPE